jgi:hypothetical protein
VGCGDGGRNAAKMGLWWSHADSKKPAYIAETKRGRTAAARVKWVRLVILITGSGGRGDGLGRRIRMGAQGRFFGAGARRRGRCREMKMGSFGTERFVRAGWLGVAGVGERGGVGGALCCHTLLITYEPSGIWGGLPVSG